MKTHTLLPLAALILAAPQAAPQQAALPASEPARAAISTVADLTSDPDGARLGLLLPGAQVEILETREGWARVKVEGWVRAEEGWQDGGASPAARPAPPAPVPAAAPAHLEGSVFVTGKKGKGIVGAGIAVRLITDTPASRASLAEARAACRETAGALMAEIEALQKQAETMLSKPADATTAFQGYDAAKRQKAEKMKQLVVVDRECMNGLDAAADRHAARRAVTDAEGRFRFDAVAAGSWLVHAWLDADEMRHEWDVPLQVAEGAAVQLDLTEANRTRSMSLPK